MVWNNILFLRNRSNFSLLGGGFDGFFPECGLGKQCQWCASRIEMQRWLLAPMWINEKLHNQDISFPGIQWIILPEVLQKLVRPFIFVFPQELPRLLKGVFARFRRNLQKIFLHLIQGIVMKLLQEIFLEFLQFLLDFYQRFSANSSWKSSMNSINFSNISWFQQAFAQEVHFPVVFPAFAYRFLFHKLL